MQLRIVIVEDEAVVAMDVASHVHKLGHQVVGTVSTGQAAIELARQDCPDLFLMDIVLAGTMTGVETAQRLKSFCDAPIVFLTSHSDEDTLEQVGSVGALGYILKPFDDRDLKAQLEIAHYKHQAGKALRQRERQLLLIADTASIFIIHCDREARYQFVNKSFADWFGWRPEDCIGQTMEFVFGITAYASLYPYTQTVLSGQRVDFEADMLFPHLDLCHMSCSFVPEVASNGRIQGFVGVLTDITERKKAEDTARRQALELSLALQVGGLGAWETDLTTGHNVWDERVPVLLGIPADEAATAASHWPAVIHPDDRATVVQQYSAACESETRFEAEFRVLHRNGSVRWMAGRGQVVPAGEGKRMVGIVQDITERKEQEEDLRCLNDELECRVEERTHKLAQSQRQLRALATELNLAELRERKRIATDLHDHLAQLLVLTRIKLGLVKKIVSRSLESTCVEMLEQMDDALRESLSYTRTLVADLSPSVLHEFGLTAALKWLAERMNAHHHLPVTLQLASTADALQVPEDQAVLLFQSVRELLFNVVKHARCNQAVISMGIESGTLRIAVFDDGIGFDSNAPTAASPSLLSSHFGHFSIRERMLALGGTFEITSQPGKGTTARLALPLPENLATLSQKAARDFSVPVPQPSLPRQDETMRIRVLIVDDHAMLRQGLRSVLEGYSDVTVVGEAANGEEAVLAARELLPSVVVMDINMPKMNGIEATKRIKMSHPDIVVIGLSVNAASDNQEALQQAGAWTVLTKEGAVEELYSTIKQALWSATGPLQPNSTLDVPGDMLS